MYNKDHFKSFISYIPENFVVVNGFRSELQKVKDNNNFRPVLKLTHKHDIQRILRMKNHLWKFVPNLFENRELFKYGIEWHFQITQYNAPENMLKIIKELPALSFYYLSTTVET